MQDNTSDEEENEATAKRNRMLRYSQVQKQIMQQ